MCYAGAYSAVSTAAHGTDLVRKAGTGAIRENALFEEAQSEAESTDTWPFDDMSIHAPTALQHKPPSPEVAHSASIASAEYKVNMLEIADSAWETLHQEQHMRRFSNSSGSTTCDTCFIRHVGDKLFDNIVK